MSRQEAVLDTLADCATRLRTKGCTLFAAELEESRSQIAELIAAAKEAENDARILGMTTARLSSALAALEESK